MEFKEYEQDAQRTLINLDLNYKEKVSMLSMGLCGEAGEVVEMLKKYLYHGHYLLKEELTKELGDVLWYVAALAMSHDISLEQIAQTNIIKRKLRYPQGFTQNDSINRVE